MPYWKRADSSYYYGRVWDSRANAWTEDRSLKVKDARAADSACREWERRLADPAYAAQTTITLEKALAGLQHYLNQLHLRGKRATPTISYHTDKAGPLLRVIGSDALIARISPQVIEDYRSARHAEGSSEHNTTKELRTLKYALRIAKLNGQFVGDLEAIFPRLEMEYRPRERVLSEEEVYAFCALPEGRINVNTRRREAGGNDVAAQIAFSVATGAEPKCIASAMREDVTEDGRFVLLRGTKNVRRWRTVPIVTPLQKSLLTFALEHGEGEERLFAGRPFGLTSSLRRTAKALGVGHVSPNDLRRTFATLMREAGAPIELIAPLMGHKDTRMLERVYARLSPQALSERLYVALNASAACSNLGGGNAQTGSSTLNVGKPKLAKVLDLVEPTAGLEPATYGLRNRILIVDYTVDPHTFRLTQCGV